MTIEKLRQFAEADPFRPFTISLADGRRIRVPEPGCLWIPPRSERTFFVAEGEAQGYTIDLLLVSSLDVDLRPRRGNGRGNGRKH